MHFLSSALMTVKAPTSVKLAWKECGEGRRDGKVGAMTGPGSPVRMQAAILAVIALAMHAFPAAAQPAPVLAYLVRTDSSTILFDVGGNLESSDPSPLISNMRRLGVRLPDIDTIVISHNHMDHVGGLSFSLMRTFSLEARQGDLGSRRVYVPVPMSYPGIEPVVVQGPMMIAPGVATTGPIGAVIHMGPVAEQALAVHVEGKGVVLIVGCGHQGVSRLLERTSELFDVPLHGVIGGLHYPVPRGRSVNSAGVDLQRWATYGTGSGPTRADVERDIDLLAARGLQWVSLSAHDSSDEMIEAFRARFGARFQDLRVGAPQVITGAAP